MRSSLSLLFLLTICLPVFSQNGYEIKVKVDNYTEDVLYLAYHYGNKQYLQDTAKRQPDNSFLFTNDESLAPGTYSLVMAPDNYTLDFLIDEDEQRFGLSFDRGNAIETLEVTGASRENQIFFSYLRFLEQKRNEAEKVTGKDADNNNKKSEAKKQKRMDALTKKVKAYQDGLIADHPASLAAAIVKASLTAEYPDFKGTEQEKQTKLWRYAQAHHFDNIDVADPRMLRTPVLQSKVDYFIQKLQIQHPDTISLAIDQLLAQMKPATDTYEFFVIHFLNEYAKSKIIGMDAVYVHMVENYYTGGKAPWVDSGQLEKIMDDAARLKPLLIGKTAPNIKLSRPDGSEFALHDVEAEYTILYFWRFDCDHCKKSTPDLSEFYTRFKDKGVKMLAVCTKGPGELQGCWDYADEKNLDGWIMAGSASGSSLERGPFHVRSTPQIFVLDQNKVIKSKRLSASQLAEVVSGLMKVSQ